MKEEVGGPLKGPEGLSDVQRETSGGGAPEAGALNTGPEHRRTPPVNRLVQRSYSRGGAWGGWAHLHKVRWKTVGTHGLQL